MKGRREREKTTTTGNRESQGRASGRREGAEWKEGRK